MPEIELQAIIGQRIAKARKAINVSQADLAAAIGVHVQTLSRWERGVRTPDAVQLREIGMVLGVSVDYLLALVED